MSKINAANVRLTGYEYNEFITTSKYSVSHNDGTTTLTNDLIFTEHEGKCSIDFDVYSGLSMFDSKREAVIKLAHNMRRMSDAILAGSYDINDVGDNWVDMDDAQQIDMC